MGRSFNGVVDELLHSQALRYGVNVVSRHGEIAVIDPGQRNVD